MTPFRRRRRCFPLFCYYFLCRSLGLVLVQAGYPFLGNVGKASLWMELRSTLKPYSDVYLVLVREIVNIPIRIGFLFKFLPYPQSL